MVSHSDYQENMRRRAIAFAVSLTANTPLSPQRYERQLLKQYEQGVLTIDEVLELLARSTYHIIYRSKQAHRLTTQELEEILDWSQTYNKDHQITGMLLYSDGLFVQVLEGREEQVRKLFAQIQQDLRHMQVVTVCEGPCPQRIFADWSMGIGHVRTTDLEEFIQVMELPVAHGVLLDDPKLQALLQAFSFPATF